MSAVSSRLFSLCCFALLAMSCGAPNDPVDPTVSAEEEILDVGSKADDGVERPLGTYTEIAGSDGDFYWIALLSDRTFVANRRFTHDGIGVFGEIARGKYELTRTSTKRSIHLYEKAGLDLAYDYVITRKLLDASLSLTNRRTGKTQVLSGTVDGKCESAGQCALQGISTNVCANRDWICAAGNACECKDPGTATEQLERNCAKEGGVCRVYDACADAMGGALRNEELADAMRKSECNTNGKGMICCGW